MPEVQADSDCRETAAQADSDCLETAAQTAGRIWKKKAADTEILEESGQGTEGAAAESFR